MSEALDFPRWVDFNGSPSHETGVINLREVAEGLYVGGFAAPGFLPNGVKFELILDVDGSSKEHGDEYPAPFVCLRFPDGVTISSELLEQIYVLLARTQGPVLVHCALGLSRSAAIAYILLRLRHGLSHDESLRRVRTPAEYADAYPRPETLASVVKYVEQKLEQGQAP